MNVLDSIGNTPLIQLSRIVPSGSGHISVKLEMCNPTGSMKDRMARAVIEAAEHGNRLTPGGTVVEYTGGTTGISLAFVCAAKGYNIEIVPRQLLFPLLAAHVCHSSPETDAERGHTACCIAFGELHLV
jgi:cysteine synthase